MALQHLRSTTANKRPLPANMADGQVAVNTNTSSPGLFVKDSAAGLLKIGPTHIGTTAPNLSPAAGGATGNTVAEQWLDTSGANPLLKVWDGSAWRTVQPVTTGTVVSTTDVGTITSTMILDETIANDDISTTASIAHSKLASITAGRVLLGNASNVPTATTVSGDVTITSAGVTTVSNGAITNAKVSASAAIADTKLATISTAGKVSNSATTATNGNTVNTIVARDANGNFSAGTISASLNGNASTATNASTVTTNANLTGDVTSVGNATSIAAGVIVNADISASAAIADTKLATISTAGKVSNSATTATSANTASAIVARDGSGNFTAGTITAALTGAASSNVLKAGDTMTGALLHPLGTAALPSITFTGNTNTGIFSPGADQVAVATNGSERARIDSSGRLLVGTSTASNFLGTNFPASIQSTELGNQFALGLERATNNGLSVNIAFRKTRSTTSGGVGIVQSGDAIASLRFFGTDGVGAIQAAGIAANVDGTPGENDMPGRLVFSTTADGASSPTERMRIDSGGTVSITGGIGQLSNKKTNAGNLFVSTAAGTNTGGVSIESYGTATTNRIHFSFSNPNGVVGSISTSASETSYNTSSDYRLKENITLLDGAIDRLKLLPVHRFNFIADPGTVVDGFIAHEAAEVVPECVTGAKDEVDEDGNPVYQGIDQSKIVPLLTAALQEAVAKIETLEQRLAAAGID